MIELAPGAVMFRRMNFRVAVSVNLTNVIGVHSCAAAGVINPVCSEMGGNLSHVCHDLPASFAQFAGPLK